MNAVELLQTGESYFLEKHYVLSKKYLDLTLELSPNNSRALELLAYVVFYLGDQHHSMELLKKCSLQSDCSASALFELGSLELAHLNYNEAIKALRDSILKGNDSFEVYHELGTAYSAIKQYTEGLHFYLLAQKQFPHSPELNFNIARIYDQFRDYQNAVKFYNIALEFKPDFPEAWTNLGIIHYESLNYSESLNAHQKAITCSPSFADAWLNMGITLQALRRLKEANSCFDKALEITPNCPNTLFHKSLLELSNGNYLSGWKNYENRWRRITTPPDINFKLKRVTSLSGLKLKKVLVWYEQGLGDTLQFCRYLTDLSNHVDDVTFYCQPILASMISSSFSRIAVISEFPLNLLDFDYQIPLLSLPLLFNSTLRTIPATVPYLKANKQKVADWAITLNRESHRFKVGLVWNGGLRLDQPELWNVNNRRNINFSLISELRNLLNIDFYSLQKGNPAELDLIEDQKKYWPQANFFNPSSQIVDFDDTAAAIENLDLVISVDTSTAHLAGALGKKVWILNRFDSCWRWSTNSSQSSWYPTARIYNQSTPGDWSTVIVAVKNDLEKLTGNV